jgi:hypothetical protein
VSKREGYLCFFFGPLIEVLLYSPIIGGVGIPEMWLTYGTSPLIGKRILRQKLQLVTQYSGQLEGDLADMSNL